MDEAQYDPGRATYRVYCEWAEGRHLQWDDLPPVEKETWANTERRIFVAAMLRKLGGAEHG